MAHLSDCIRNAGSSVINNTHKAVQIRQKGNYKDRRVCVGPNGGSIQDLSSYNLNDQTQSLRLKERCGG